MKWYWYQLAAEQGFAAAQHNLAVMHRDGLDVAQDYAEAVKWWRLAAEQDHVGAQNNLGTMYREGQGVPQDAAEAAKWFRLAADQGLARAQYNLGDMYAKGHGAPQDYVQAHMWFNLAASRLPPGKDLDTAVEGRDLLADLMAPAQIAEARRLAREWRPKRPAAD